MKEAKNQKDLNYANKILNQIKAISDKMPCSCAETLWVTITRDNHIEASFKKANGFSVMIRTIDYNFFINRYLKQILNRNSLSIKAKDVKDYVIKVPPVVLLSEKEEQSDYMSNIFFAMTGISPARFRK